MDAAGKDGTIRQVMSGVNPQGCQVFTFKHPIAAETRPYPNFFGGSAGGKHHTAENRPQKKRWARVRSRRHPSP